MKNLLSMLAVVAALTAILSSCASDENYDDISSNVNLEQTAPTTGGGTGGTDNGQGSEMPDPTSGG